MTTASCLITSTPDFEPPAQTPPFLVADNANPDPRQIVLVQPDTDDVTFSAFVRSEDASSSIYVRLFIDYGTQSPDGKPYRIAFNGKSVKASHMDDRTRVASASWNRGYPLEGCHRFTLIVSHGVDDDDCPFDLADSDSITWNAQICVAGHDCPGTIDPSVDCALPDNPASCPQISPELTSTSSSSGMGGAQ